MFKEKYNEKYEQNAGQRQNILTKWGERGVNGRFFGTRAERCEFFLADICLPSILELRGALLASCTPVYIHAYDNSQRLNFLLFHTALIGNIRIAH